MKDMIVYLVIRSDNMGDVKRINRSNIHDLISISKLLNIGDLDKAGKYLKEYQVKYPDSNHFVYLSTYARYLGQSGNYDEAIDILKSILNKDKKSNNVSESIFYLVILLLKSCRYDEAYYYCGMIDYKELENRPFRFTTNTIRSCNFLKRELGFDDDVYDINSYSMMQLYYYSDYLAKRHIYEKHNIDIESSYSFNMDYEIFERLYSVINLALLYALKSFEFTYGDMYYFRIKDVGINLYDGVSTDILKVITNNNSLEILSMYPVENQKNSNRIINEIITEQIMEYHSTKKRKVVSQVDKFNSKYSLQK